MKQKFLNIPKDSDTKIVFQEEKKFDNIDIMYQKLVWDGVVAESIIFVNDDILKLTNEEIEQKIKAKGMLEPYSTITIKNNMGFTIANFNFDVT